MTPQERKAFELALEMVQNKMYAHAEMYLKEALAQPEQSQVEETLRYEIDALEAKLAEYRAQPAQEVDWEKLYRLEVKKKEALAAKYERDIKPLTKIVPMAQPEGCQCPACKITPHASDCAVHNAPAYPVGKCDCGAQPAQEPVAWMDGYRNIYSLEEKAAGCEDAVIPLVPATLQHWSDCSVHNEPAYPAGKCDCGGYTTPPHRKPLTDEEIILIVADCASSHQHTDIHFARAIETAHGIKE